MTFLTAMGRSVLVINSPEVATDLLDKKGQIYSDRPRSDKGELKGVAILLFCNAEALSSHMTFHRTNRRNDFPAL